MELQKKSLHFVGIGGIGMSGLAELLHRQGNRVTGSDLSRSPQVKRLESLGIPVFIGHKASQMGHPDIVVYSSAVQKDNVELVSAREKNLLIMRRAEILAELMRLKRGIVVAGTHGKTTTTALLASIFTHAGEDPTVIAGGRVDFLKSTARLGKGEWFIAESDESDGSFHHLFPELVVLTNVDRDHIDFYSSFVNLKKNFKRFLDKIPFYGYIIACGDCKNVKQVIKKKYRDKNLVLWFSKR